MGMSPRAVLEDLSNDYRHWIVLLAVAAFSSPPLMYDSNNFLAEEASGDT